MATATAPGSEEREQRVTPLELFFDLVFVFAITQVTARMAEKPSWEGLGEGLLILAAVWWSWVAYSWLTNYVNSDEGGPRLVMFAAMVAMLILALAVPDAFGDDALIFGIAYLVVKALWFGVYEVVAKDDPEVRAAIRQLAVPILIAPLLIIGASFLDGTAQAAVWIVALAIDYSGPLLGDVGRWRLAPAHFAERHALIIIIALGESIVALGVGGTDAFDLTAGVLAGAALGMGVVAALWWAYFDVVALVAERKLAEATGRARNTQARDSYSYLHLPMIAGIVLFALGVKKTLGHTGEALKWETATALCGGVALYLLAHIAFRARNVRSLNRQRLAAALVLVALIPLAHEVPSLLALALVFAVCATLIAYEAVRFKDARARIRHAHA